MGLADFAAQEKQEKSLTSTDRWFADRPKVYQEMLDGHRSGVNKATILRWLRTEHQFPFKYDAIQRVFERIQDA